MRIRPIVLLAIAAIVGGSIVAAEAQQPSRGGELVFGGSVRLDSLDPQIVSFLFTREILNNIYDPLVRQKPGDPKIYPGLATAWKVADDKLSYVLTLRRDVKFHDGTPFNAAAVCFSFD